MIKAPCDMQYGLLNDSRDTQAKVTLEVGFIQRYIESKYFQSNMSGWPSGLRRQTQELSCTCMSEHSGPRMWAWVQIPLLTTFVKIYLF